MSDAIPLSPLTPEHALVILTRVADKDRTTLKQIKRRIKEIFREAMTSLKAAKEHRASPEATDPGPVDSTPIDTEMTSAKGIKTLEKKIQSVFQRISIKIDPSKSSRFMQSPTQLGGKES